MAAAALLGFAACDDGNENNETPLDPTDIAGTYNGYTDAKCQMFNNSLTENESFTITANNDNTASFSFATGEWGTYTINKLKLTEKNGVYTISGSGTTTISTMQGGTTTKDYTLTGTIKSATDAILVISLPELMFGTTITFKMGTVPDGLKITSATGYSGHSIAYAGPAGTTPYDGETLYIKYADGKTAISFTSKGLWGTYKVDDVTVAKDNDGNYTVSGNGTASIAPMGQGDPTDYTCTVAGTIKSITDAEIVFSVPIMGGMTMTFKTGARPTE